MTSRAALLALVAALAVAAAGCGRSSETPDTFVVGAVEDAAKSGHPDAKMLLARQAGFRAIVLSAVWTPPLEAPPAAELAALEKRRHRSRDQRDPADRRRVLVQQRRPRRPRRRGRSSPRTRRRSRVSCRASATSCVGNEPNLNLFWLPQFGPDGSDAAAASYLALLAESYDALKDVSPDINVIGGVAVGARERRPGRLATDALPDPVHRGSRDRVPGLGARHARDGHVLDPPVPGELEHPAGLRAPADHRRSAWPTTTSSWLCSARPSTARPSRAPRSRSSTASTASRQPIPQQKLGRYTGTEQATTKPIDEAGPGSPVRRRDRDRGLPPDGADAALLPRLGRAAARAAPDRRLLRRRHAEVEPGGDRARGPRRPGAAPGVPVGGRGEGVPA